ncbi:HxlR family transcriptional regulator [Latilactobacillus curvatus]|uniref:winged helix-turn-helix transcriptional regulator n=1 Tax=Latilactobacillus curvatus TaxID=28038 RepID=UPI000814B717|nr:helix-turn-helix domain-containing protein [Latilactobacillus curvatus]ANY13817.1 HxlR family transcriptional regulator [Latilactobacillus curvatus]MCM0725591.1 helix-turn-helix transcriptional regulator [Latilactobacillus curvatus]
MVQERHIYDCQAGCPVESTLQIISGKWKSVIIYQLLQHSDLHFGDLTRILPDCSRRMLALQLEELIADHVITKTVISLRPLKTEYQLSELGQTLSPVINAMATWGTYYNQVQPQTKIPIS